MLNSIKNPKFKIRHPSQSTIQNPKSKIHHPSQSNIQNSKSKICLPLSRRSREARRRTATAAFRIPHFAFRIFASHPKSNIQNPTQSFFAPILSKKCFLN
jgi:hypothetical protein